MRIGPHRYAARASALLLLWAVVAASQQKDPEPAVALPESTNSAPMESVWDFAPEAPGGRLTQTGPYYVSRWGNIVIRGRLDNGRVISALNVIQCGRRNDPRTQVVMIGQKPAGLCSAVKPLRPGTTQSISGKKFNLYGQSTGWVVMDFVQIIGGLHAHNGIGPIDDHSESAWGTTSLGAVLHNENGKHVIYAPGETVTLPHGVTFVVAPIMDDQELEAMVIGDALRGFDGDADLVRIASKAKRPPIWFLILFFAVPIAAIAGVIYAIRRFLRGRRGAGPQRTGALPTFEHMKIPLPANDKEPPAV